MANSSVIGALRVTLGMDSAAFQRDLKQTQSKLSKFGNQVAKGLAVATAAAAAAATGVAIAIGKTVDEFDNMAKASRSFGIPVEELSALKYAADLAGLSFQDLGNALRTLNKNILDASISDGRVSQAFEALGISVTDAEGKLKTTSVVLREVADAISQLENPTERAAAAGLVFGERYGPKLASFLAEGSAGIDKMIAEAKRLGLVIDQDAAEAAERFNDNMTRVGSSVTNLKNALTTALLPALDTLAQKLANFVSDGARVQAAAQDIAQVFAALGGIAIKTAGYIAAIGAEIDGLIGAVNAMKSLDFSGARDAWNVGQQEAQKIIQDYQNLGNAIGNSINQGIVNSALDSRLSDSLGESAKTAGASVGQSFVDGFLGGEGGGTKGKGKGGGGGGGGISDMAREAAQIFEQTRTPLENYEAAVARLNDLLRAGALDQDTYNRAVLQAKDAYDAAAQGAESNILSLGEIGQTIASTITGAFQGLIDGSKDLSDVLSDLLKKLGDLLLNSAFQALFGDGGSSGGGIIGGVLSSLFGFAQGGSFQVGGSGGIDSQLVAFKASPNETVSVTKPNQAAMNSGGGEVPVRVYVDEDGNWHAAVERISAGTADQVSKLNISNFSSYEMPGRVQQIKKNPRAIG